MTGYTAQAAPVASPQPDDPIEYPLHVEVEVLLAQMAGITARQFELEQDRSDAASLADLGQVRKAMQAMRFPFDPCSKSEALAIVQRIGQYASALQIGRSN